MKPKRTCLRVGCDHTDCEREMKQPVMISGIMKEFDEKIDNEWFCDSGEFEEHECCPEHWREIKEFLRSSLEAFVDELVFQKKELMDKWTLEHATIGLQEEDMRNVGFNEAVDKLNAKREEIKR